MVYRTMVPEPILPDLVEDLPYSWGTFLFISITYLVWYGGNGNLVGCTRVIFSRNIFYTISVLVSFININASEQGNLLLLGLLCREVSIYLKLGMIHMQEIPTSVIYGLNIINL